MLFCKDTSAVSMENSYEAKFVTEPKARPEDLPPVNCLTLFFNNTVVAYEPHSFGRQPAGSDWRATPAPRRSRSQASATASLGKYISSSALPGLSPLFQRATGSTLQSLVFHARELNQGAGSRLLPAKPSRSTVPLFHGG
jgi:hypothetical protein